MRGLRWVGYGVGVLAALVIGLLLAIKLFVNPNDYRARVEQAVQRATGRQLQLSGNLKLSVFPWVALELGPASLGNPAGFSADPFAKLARVALRVKLLPLLHQRLEIGRIEIDGLDLRLQKNAAGKGNWQDFGNGQSATADKQPAATESGSGVGMLQEVGGVIVKDSRVSFQDKVADHIEFTMGRLAAHTATPLDLTLDLTSAQIGKPVTFKFSTPELRLDLPAQTVAIPAFALQFDKTRLTGTLQGQKILDAPQLSGSFRLDQMSPRQLMSALGMQAPATRDPKALSSFAASGQFVYGNNAARATALDLRLDDSRLQGESAITDLDTGALDFNLALDRIDIDRYLSPAPGPGARPAAAPAPKPTADSASAAGSGDMIRKLQMKGTFAIGSLTVAGLDLSQVKVSAQARDGVVHIAPMTASLYGGNYIGDITLTQGTTQGATLSLKLEQTLSHVDIAKLLQDLAHTGRLSGRGNVTTSLTAQGWDAADITRSLNGRVTMNLADGAVEGVDLWFEINRALALIQRQPMPSGSSSGRTKFDTFMASADLSNGVATTKDLNIVSQNLRVTGQGTSNLITDQVNYQVTASVLKELPNAAKASGTNLADIPLTVTGPMSSPQVRPDLEGMAKARVQQELGKHQDEIKQKVQDTLKGLFK